MLETAETDLREDIAPKKTYEGKRARNAMICFKDGTKKFIDNAYIYSDEKGNRRILIDFEEFIVVVDGNDDEECTSPAQSHSPDLC